MVISTHDHMNLIGFLSHNVVYQSINRNKYIVGKHFKVACIVGYKSAVSNV